MILVKTFFAFNDLRNYSYLILENETGDAWVIDPYEAGPLIDYIKKNGLVLRGILNTHQHFDHIRGNAPLMELFKAPVKRLKSSEKVKLNDEFSLETLDTPGHTLDHQVFIWKKDDSPIALFSGDTLFNAGVGNCRNGGDVNQLYSTTNLLLKSLPASTVLYPGHDYRRRNLEFALSVEPENKVIKEKLSELKSETQDLPPVSLGEELKVNPFFRLNSDEIRNTISTSAEKETFIKLRQLRDQW